MTKRKILSLLLSTCMFVSLLTPVSAAEYKDADSIPGWAAKSVDRWTDAGIMGANKDGNFDPTHRLTRAEFAILLCKLMGYTEKSDPSTFTDLPKDDTQAADALLKLHSAGVMMGVGNDQADPNGNLTREHVAVMVFRALELSPSSNAGTLGFVDADQVSKWAKAEMATMASLKMIDGVGNNTLAPKRDIPNQDMAALLDKMVAAYVTKSGETVDLSKAANPNGAVIIKATNVKIANAADSAGIVITEDAPKNTSVSVTGASGDITVSAEGAKIIVAKDSTVDTISIDAPKASVEVSGTVGSVAVAEGADSAAVTAKTGAKIGAVTTSAEKVKVNGANGTIATVTAVKGSAEVKAKGAQVSNEGATSVMVDGKALAKGGTQVSNTTGSGSSSSSGGGSGGGSGSSTPSVTLTAAATGEGGKLAVGDKLTASVSNAGGATLVWNVGGFDQEGSATEYTVTAADLGKVIFVKLVKDGKQVAKSSEYTVASSAPLDTSTEGKGTAPVVLGDDVVFKTDDGGNITVDTSSEDTKLVLTVAERTVSPEKAAETKTAVEDDVKTSVAKAIYGDDKTSSDLNSEDVTALNTALNESAVKAMDVDLTMVTTTTDEATGETTTEETTVHPVGTTTVKLSAAQLGMAGEDLNLYHFVASHTNKANETQTVTGTVDEKGENVTFVTNGLSTIWIGNVPPRTVTFTTNGGTAVASQKVKFGNRVNTSKLPEKIERTGYLFCGWNYDLAVTPIIENMTISAVWVTGVQVPANRITATLSGTDSNVTLTKENGKITAAAKKDAESFAANLKVNLTVSGYPNATKYGVSASAQVAAEIKAKDMKDVTGSVTLDPATVTDAAGKVVAGKTSYYIKWVDAKGDVLALEEIVVVVDDGQGAADSKTVTRNVNRGLGRFEAYLTSTTNNKAPTWVGYINGHIEKSYNETRPDDYDLNFSVGFNRHGFGTDYQASDYDTLTLEFTPFSDENFASKTISAKFRYYNGTKSVEIPCTPVQKGDGKLTITLDTKQMGAPATRRYINPNLYLTVDGVESMIYCHDILNPNYEGNSYRDNQSVSFTDMASLKNALSNAAEDKYWNINYEGNSQFTISESITVPFNCNVYLGENSATVASGVTVTMQSAEDGAAQIYCGGIFTVEQGGKIVAITHNYDGVSSLTFAEISGDQITFKSGSAIEVREHAPFMLYNHQSNSTGVCTLESGATAAVTSGSLNIQNFKTVKLGARVDVGGESELYLHNDSNIVSGTVSIDSSNWRGAEFYGTTTIANTGKVHASGGDQWNFAVEFNGPLNNQGSITVSSGTQIIVSNMGYACQSSGTIELNGTLDLSGTKLVNTGTITGSGTITGALGDDTTSYDERNGLTYVEVSGNETPSNYSRYKFTFDPYKTAEVTLYKASLSNEQGGTCSIAPTFEEFPEN